MHLMNFSACHSNLRTEELLRQEMKKAMCWRQISFKEGRPGERQRLRQQASVERESRDADAPAVHRHAKQA
ncbi:hypothetical protein F2P79_011224 [Pimephales promelas]|nr:hypothetical protein F2P79_011224 [Pimephales promelas]